MNTAAINFGSKVRSGLLLAICLIFTVNVVAQDKVGTTSAPFLGISSGARASAMGGAYVAISNDGSGMFWNPGGVAHVSSNAVTFSNMNWFVDSQFQDASVIINAGTDGNFALSIRALNYGEIDVTTIENPEGTGERFTPTDLAVAFTYSTFLTDKFSVGGTGKFIQQKIWNEKALGFAVDLGMLYQTDFKNLRIGMSISNFGTDMTLSGDDLRRAIDIAEDQSGNNDRLEGYLGVDSWSMPLLFKVGIAMDLIDTDLHRVVVALDAKHPNDNSESIDVGIEYGFNDLVFFRGGYKSLLSSQTEDQGLTAGFGLKYNMNDFTANFGAAYMTHSYLDSPLLWTLQIDF